MRQTEAGFTLIETLVAFAVLALAMIALFRAVTGGLESVRRAEQQALAVELAQSLLDGAGRERPLAPGTSSGASVTGYRWDVTVAPYEAGRARSAAPRVAAYWVAVTVRWPGTGSGQSLSLRTLKLAGGGF